jgi:hypothetical protein
MTMVESEGIQNLLNEFLGIREKSSTAEFKPIEFDGFKNRFGLIKLANGAGEIIATSPSTELGRLSSPRIFQTRSEELSNPILQARGWPDIAQHLSAARWPKLDNEILEGLTA